MPTQTANPNFAYNADIVITPTTRLNSFGVWQNNKQIATATPAALNLIVAGASASKLSVYDAASRQFLTGTLAQLTKGA